jgi:hypothetical protein
VEVVRRLGDLAGVAGRRLDDVDLGPDLGLFGRLARSRDQLSADLTTLRSQMERGSAGAAGVADMLTGSHRYLVFAANNAEMRAGSGMFLSVGVLSSANGSIHLGDLKPAGDLTLPGEGVAIDDADLAARWGFLHPGREWRNLAASPRFDAVAPLAARMWTARTGEPIDGVLALDAAAVKAVLQGTGPVSVGSSAITSRNVEDILLHDQYLAYPDEAADQSARREQLGVIAASALDAMDRGNYHLGPLASGLAAAARGRHVLAWSSRPGELEGWKAAGISGSLSSDSMMVSVLSRGGNKLDHFLPMTVHLELHPSGSSTLGVVRIGLKNQTPDGQPTYVAGPHPDSGVGRNVYKGIVAVDLPARAGDVTIDGNPPLRALGRDGPAQVIASEVTLDQGQTTDVIVRFRLSGRKGSFRVEPDARIPVTRWFLGRSRWWADGSHVVRW